MLNYLKQHRERTFSANCIIEVHIVNIIKGSKFNRRSSFQYAELLQVSLKEDLVDNGYFVFEHKVISKSQYAEEFIKSFQFSLVTTLPAFECHKRERVFVGNKRAVG